MSKEVTFKLNLKVDGKDVVKKLTVDVEELQRVIGESKSAADKFTASLIKWNQISETVLNISGGLSQLSGTLNGLTGESRSFGAAMASANTMAGKSGEDFANLKDQVAELSKTIPIARDELANGLYQVISNGVPEDNWIEYLNQSARASVGGIADLGETVKVTSTIIKNYGLQWSDAGSIQDKIQLTAKNGVTSFEQLAQALPRVTSQASTLGVSIDELMATFSTLTGVSGNTAEVSTQLAAIFTALIKPSSEATEMAQQMGIQFDAAAIKAAGGMEQFLQSLDKSVKQYAASSGMLEQEIYGKLFGSAESLRALTPLTNQLADKFKENVAAMQDSTGTIDDAFNTMSSTGSATLQMLNNKFGEVTDAIQSSIGNLLPYLNFGSQLTMTISSVAQLGVAIKSLGITTTITTAAIKAYNIATAAAVSLTAAPFLALAAGLGVLAVGYANVKAQIDDTDRKSRELRETIADLRQKHEENNAAIRKYLPIAQDATKKTSDRKDAIAKLKALYPDYFKNLDIATSKQYNIANAVNAANKAYRDQLVLIAKQAKMQYEKSKANYEKNQNGGQMGGTNPGMNIMMNQQDKANMETDLKLWKESEKAVKDYDKTMKQSANRPPAPKPQKPKPAPATTTPTKTTVKPSPTPTTTDKTDKPDPVKGSLDWYEKAISDKEKELKATADEATAKVLNNQVEGLQRELYMLKVRVGIEAVPEIEVKPIKSDILDKLDEEIKNLKLPHVKTSIEIDTEDIERIKSLSNIDLSNMDSVQSALLNIKDIVKPTAQGFAIAGASCEALGGAMQQLGADSAAAKAGLIMAALGQIALSFAQAMTSASKNWVTWLAFGVAGTAELVSMVSTISGFNTGGIVGGNETSGDRVLVRVNSGEMILNAAQQARLFALANGAAVYGASAQVGNDFARGGMMPAIQVNASRLQDLGRESGQMNINLRLRGRDLVGAVANETRSNRRRSNIRIG